MRLLRIQEQWTVIPASKQTVQQSTPGSRIKTAMLKKCTRPTPCLGPRLPGRTVSVCGETPSQSPLHRGGASAILDSVFNPRSKSIPLYHHGCARMVLLAMEFKPELSACDNRAHRASVLSTFVQAVPLLDVGLYIKSLRQPRTLPEGKPP